MGSLWAKTFDVSSKSTLFLLLSNYACYVYLTKCGMLKSSTSIFLLLLFTLARVFILCIVKTFCLMDKISCNYTFIEVSNYYQIKMNYSPFNEFALHFMSNSNIVNFFLKFACFYPLHLIYFSDIIITLY